MAAKVCKECNSKTGAVGCNHWQHWPENIHRPHDWTSEVRQNQKVRCLECGFETTISNLATGKVSGFNCPEYKIQKPKSTPKRVRMKVANAFSAGEHKILWLAGGMAVYQKPGYEEIFSTLDEAMKNCSVNLHLTQDLELIEHWKAGYELPADEHYDWPHVFLADESTMDD